MFNKAAIAQQFSKSIHSYQQAASLQLSCAKELCDLASPYISWDQKPTLLDLGSGTGFIAQRLPSTHCHLVEVDLSFAMLHYAPQKDHIFKVQADIEALPFLDQQCDAIFSSFSLQWVNDLNNCFKALVKLLKPGGILAFAIPIHPSLSTLKAANIFRFNSLPTFDDVKDALDQTNLEMIAQQQSQKIQTFDNGIAAIKSIKQLGANHTKDSFKRVTKKQIEEFNSFCLKNLSNTDKNIEISWNICHVIYRRNQDI